jgi:exosortase E/protease (VPEID-CTERM system)
MWVFRAHLRFPQAFCLIPIGIAAIWVLNAVRIALLVSIGAHVSPAMALEGFHSWSGWITFVAATAGIMVAARQSAFIFVAPQGRAQPADEENSRRVVAYLAPFAAFMAARIVASAAAPYEQWLYPLTVAAVGAALWWFRRDYAHLMQRVSWVSVACGLAVGIAWIVTDPQQPSQSSLGPWLASLPAALAAGWLALRALGSALLIPIAEELAFRGYLCRFLERSATRFHLTPGQVRLIALLVSSAAFGLLHERYVAAALAGAVYAALMYRTNRLSDPIAAHMASNAAIVLWSIAAGQWTLL